MKSLKDKYYLAHADRLFKEWEEHKKIIIAVDFDDTISPWKLATMEECQEVVNQIMKAKKLGAYVVIFSACDEDRYDAIREHCGHLGLEIDAINRNPIDLPYGRNNKIYANIFIDDRAGMGEALYILHLASTTYFNKYVALKENETEF